MSIQSNKYTSSHTERLEVARFHRYKFIFNDGGWSNGGGPEGGVPNRGGANGGGPNGGANGCCPGNVGDIPGDNSDVFDAAD